VATRADADPQRAELRARGDIETAELRKVAEGELAPMTARLLAEMLGSRGDREGAIAVLKASQERHADHFPTALRLAQRLSWSGDHEGALRFAGVATSLRPGSAGAALLKGAMLFSVGKYRESLRWYERSHAAGEEVRRLAAMEPRLDRIVGGDAEPGDAAEARESAWLALRRKSFARAAELFGKEADLARDAADRDLAGYNAVRMTARASAADSVSVVGGLRAQALTWLRARVAASPDPETLRLWLEDGDLAGLREPEELAKLPASERAAFESVWADVREALGP
jgi:tetratricopeptide (TPR) repeat protein